MLCQFDKKHIKDEWVDLTTEFSEFFLDPSEDILFLFETSKGVSMPSNIEDVVNLRFGFECGSGWKSIIWDYCIELRTLIEKAKSNNEVISYKGFIFKEKFGELRDQGTFSGKDRQAYLVDFINLQLKLREKSAHTCEVCGGEGKLKTNNIGGGWMKTLCSTHYKEWKKD